MKARKWVLVRHFQGEPGDGDLELQEYDLPELKDGDILLEGVCWTVDPYMRRASNDLSHGDVMLGSNVGKVVQSKNDKYPVGTYLLASIGWREHSVINPDTLPGRTRYNITIPSTQILPEMGNLPKSVGLGVLGMPGATAYFGFLEICKPKPGETVLVNGAAGAVGSLVGQIAKIKGCTVIGFAGTEEKCKFIKDDLGFDFAFNYKTTDVSEALNKAAPNGIDCFFDNVGGDFTTRVIVSHMNIYGRISICGAISRYNDDPLSLPKGFEVYGLILFKQLRVEGFIVSRWYKQFPEAWAQMYQWIQQGKIKYREHVIEGFENMYSAFRGMLKGDNVGKAIITA